MAAVSKWKIPNLKKNQRFCAAGKHVLDKKLRDIFKLINKFFRDDSVEVLHDLRIAVRRFRYVLEIFYDCYEKKELKYVYDLAKKLQDLIGEGRDLDVMGEKVKGIAADINAKIPNYFFKKIETDRMEIRRKIKIELIKFMDDKYINRFIIKRG